MSKYDPLRQYLAGLPASTNSVTLTFGQIEQVLRFSLPPAAYKYPAWWSNPSSSKQHPYAQAWLGAGFETTGLDLKHKQVSFRRLPPPAIQIAAKIDPEPTPLVPQTSPSNNRNNEMSAANAAALRLLELGFEAVGEWHLDGESLAYTLSQHGAERNILYSFVVGGEVMYLGKSTQTLKQRMNGYRNPGPTQSTNIGDHAAIRKVLRQGGIVQILVFVQKEAMVYRGIPVNLAAGLEDPLIARFKPAWNKRGNG
jgi:hypothetical protein